MIRIQYRASVAAIAALVLGLALGNAGAAFKPVSVYSDFNSKDDRFKLAPDNLMVATHRANLKVDPNCTEAPHSGKTCTKINYKFIPNTECFYGVLWVPTDKTGIIDLSGATKLSFWVKASQDEDTILVARVGGTSTDKHPLSPFIAATPFFIKISGSRWEKIEIDLKGKDKDLKKVKCGFYFQAMNTFYIDDVTFE